MKQRCLNKNKGTDKHLLALAYVVIALTQSACVSLTYQRDDIERFLLTQQPAEALAILEKRKPESRSKSIYLLDMAMLLRMQGKLEASNTAFEQAKSVIQELDAISLREQAAAVSINDSMRSYLPPPFEQVLVHCFKAINYLELSQYNNARVEVLQLDELLKHKKGIQLPFARYLSGLVFEFNHELDNALIAYRKAYQAYQSTSTAIPPVLQQDLLRLTGYLGLSEEQQQYADQFGLEFWPDQQEVNQQARAIALIFNGLIPRKHSLEVNVQSPTDGQLHRISTPYYEHRTARVYSARLSTESLSTQSQLLDQLDRHAQAALNDEMPAIVARTIARVSIKNSAVDKTRNDSPLLSFALNIATFLTEQADTRAWNTLPQQILLMRLNLPPGSHDIKLELSGSSLPGTIQTWQQVNIDRGEAKMLSYHWPDSRVTHRRP